ncbi:MAG: monofunctional biosynthetic peptidoglycan transglycosylase, partial [Gemmatimonadota bacterium]|nr:monofunctional biosynthetic peptidoglycan transglycosylase [Gemmatimonadota bacterium]
PTTAFMIREVVVRGDQYPGGIRYDWVKAADISPNLALAVLAAEDQRFPVHHGFDLEEIRKAMGETGRRRGASTVSQQVAKNLFLWPGGWARKGLEAYLTVLIETLWPKRRILEVYLNVAEFGPGVFGAEGASRAYYGKPAAALTSSEAARLAAVLPSPRRMSVARPSEYVVRRGREIELRMRQLGGASYLAGVW